MYYWDYYNTTYLGRYLHDIESKFYWDRCKTFNIKKILDIGGGSGRISEYFIKRGMIVDIIERDEEAINSGLAKFSEYEKLNYLRGDIFEILRKVNDCSYDLVIANQVLSYLKINDVKNLIVNVGRILRNEGHFMFNIINYHSYKSVIKRLIKKSSKSDNAFSVFSINEYLHRNHLRINEIKGYYSFPMKRNSERKLTYIFILLDKIFMFLDEILQDSLKFSHWLLIDSVKEK